MSFELARGFRLSACEVEPLKGLIRGPAGTSRHLEPRVMDVLTCLARHGNDVVTRGDLQDTVWRDRMVTDESLTRAIHELRHAFEHVGGDASYIKTVPKRGYCLTCDVSPLHNALPRTDSAKPPRLRRFPAMGLVTVVVGALGISLLVVTYQVHTDGRTAEHALDAVGQAFDRNDPAAWKQSIAVFPFASMSDDPANQHFATGLSEEIRTLLSRTPHLKVIGRASSIAAQESDADIGAVGTRLGVNAILEGSVRMSGERIRVSTQLVGTHDNAVIWSDTYDRTKSDVFQLQDDIAAAIIGALEMHFIPEPTRHRPTNNVDAYAAYLQAGIAFNSSDLFDAERILREAISLDPDFAEAYVLLAETYTSLAGETLSAADGQRKAFDAASAALAIDPDLTLAQAYYHLANVNAYSFADVESAFRQALREQPSNGGPAATLAWELFIRGYVTEALVYAERFAELNPLEYSSHFRLCDSYTAMGRSSEAMAALELAEKMSIGAAKLALGKASIVSRDDEAAITYFESALAQADFANQWVRDAVRGARNPATGEAYLDEHIDDIVAMFPDSFAYQGRLFLSEWYLLFGYLDRYFEIILAYNLGGPTWSDAEVLIKEGIKFRQVGFTRHPLYIEVAAKSGAIEIWEQRGPPDFCSKTAGKWVCE